MYFRGQKGILGFVVHCYIYPPLLLSSGYVVPVCLAPYLYLPPLKEWHYKSVLVGPYGRGGATPPVAGIRDGISSFDRFPIHRIV